MGRVGFGRVSLSCAFAFFTGCSLFVSLDGLNDGSSAVDGSVTDGALADGAKSGTDGGSTSLDAASPCSATHDLCDDFDEVGEAVGAVPTWTGVYNEALPGTITIASDLSDSPPSALSATYPPDAAPYGDNALYRKFVGPFSAAHCEFDVRIEQLDPSTNQIFLVAIDVDAKDGTLAASWSTWDGTEQTIGMSGALLDGGSEVDDSANFGAFALRRWYHAALDWTAPEDAALPSFAMSIDGTPVAQVSLPTIAQQTQNYGFELGAIGVSPGGASSNRVLFDNVFCDVK